MRRMVAAASRPRIVVWGELGAVEPHEARYTRAGAVFYTFSAMRALRIFLSAVAVALAISAAAAGESDGGTAAVVDGAVHHAKVVSCSG